MRAQLATLQMVTFNNGFGGSSDVMGGSSDGMSGVTEASGGDGNGWKNDACVQILHICGLYVVMDYEMWWIMTFKFELLCLNS